MSRFLSVAFQNQKKVFVTIMNHGVVRQIAIIKLIPLPMLPNLPSNSMLKSAINRNVAKLFLA